jgi:hypothetical protein
LYVFSSQGTLCGIGKTPYPDTKSWNTVVFFSIPETAQITLQLQTYCGVSVSSLQRPKVIFVSAADCGHTSEEKR